MSSWLASAPDASLGGLLSLRPDLAVAYERFAGRLWDDRLVHPVLLELCRIRVAQLLRDPDEVARRTPAAVEAGLDEAAVAQLAQWPAAACFGPAERAALAVAEQFVVDVHGVTDEQMAELGRHLTPPEVVALTTALGLFDGFTRMRITLGEH